MTFKIGDKIKGQFNQEGVVVGEVDGFTGKCLYAIADNAILGIRVGTAKLIEARPVNEGDRVRRTFNNGTIVEGVIDRFDVVEDTVIGFSAQEPEIPLWNHRHPEQTEVLERAPKLPANDVVAVIVDGVLLVRDICDLEEWRYRDGLRVPRDCSDLYRKMLQGRYKVVVTESDY